MRSVRFVAPVLVAFTILVSGCGAPPPPPPQPSGTISEVAAFGNRLLDASVSADGRFVGAETLDPSNADPAYGRDNLIVDRQAAVSETAPVEGYFAEVSDDGRFLAFRRFPDTFLGPTARQWDRQYGTVSDIPGLGADYGGGFLSEPSISADGRFVAYKVSDQCPGFGCTNIWERSNAYVWDRTTGVTTQLTFFDEEPVDPWLYSRVVGDIAVSADGNHVVYSTSVSTPTTEPTTELRIWDRATATTRVIHSAVGTHTSSIYDIAPSADAARVAYATSVWTPNPDGGGTTTFDVSVWSDTGVTPAPPLPDETQAWPKLSRDGATLFYATGPIVRYSYDVVVADTIVAVDLADGTSTRRGVAEQPVLVDAFDDNSDPAVAFYFNSVDANTLYAWKP